MGIIPAQKRVRTGAFTQLLSRTSGGRGWRNSAQTLDLLAIRHQRGIMSKRPANPGASRRGGQFKQAGALLAKRIRSVGEKRGFAETKLLTHWAEICGPDLAAIALPVKISYARDGFGATLMLSCEGARATEVQMQVETIRARVNACYGYNAISRVRLTQTDSAGFAEAQRSFTGPDKPETTPQPIAPAAAQVAQTVANDALRLALARLGTNILNRNPVDPT